MLSGRSVTISLFIDEPTSALAVWMSGTSACTVTVSASVPIVIDTSSCTTWATPTVTPWRVYGENPSFLKVTVYGPGGRLRIEYRPTSLDLVDVATFVSSCVAMTSTAGTTAPL
jgi:hypothetical protein